jgi:hypothetical protein
MLCKSLDIAAHCTSVGAVIVCAVVAILLLLLFVVSDCGCGCCCCCFCESECEKIKTFYSDEKKVSTLADIIGTVV